MLNKTFCEHFLINFAGFPPTKLYGSIFLTTQLLHAITAPSPIVTPLIIYTFSPIHTSFPIITFPLEFLLKLFTLGNTS